MLAYSVTYQFICLFFPESLGFQGKPSFKKENVTYAQGGSSSFTYDVAANNLSRQTASYRFLLVAFET